MIEFYLKNAAHNTEERVNECLAYYSDMKMNYTEMYREYDRISMIQNKRLDDMNDKSFFRSGKLRKVNSCFMKECLLESLKRLVEDRASKDSKDVSSALNDSINDYRSSPASGEPDSGFNYYPDIYENDISKKLMEKEELRRHIIQNEVGSIEDKCDSNFFELAPHQLFLKNLLSPNSHYRGLLIFHGVGVGKTCSGISIAENFKDVYGEKENRIIVLASSNIQIGWRKTI